jgi:hypothetical protein
LHVTASETFRLADAFGTIIHVVIVVEEAASQFLLTDASGSQVPEAPQKK